jgi:hypothetical protein
MDGILIAGSQTTPGSNAQGGSFQDPDIFSPDLSNTMRPMWQADFEFPPKVCFPKRWVHQTPESLAKWPLH